MMTPLIDAIVNKTLWQFLPLVIVALLNSSTVLNLFVIDLLQKGTPNSISYGIEIGAVWGPHARVDEVNVLFLLCNAMQSAVMPQ